MIRFVQILLIFNFVLVLVHVSCLAFFSVYLYPPQDIATEIKKKCDEQFDGTWHVIVGRNFGSSITHDTKYVLFFQVDLLCILLFKSLE